jgi:chemosensory pili system protein ChpA (sensor histidine kinase/response regulator)
MAGIHIIGDIAGPWEKFARLVKGSNHHFDRPVIDLLIETQSYLSNGLNSLKDSGTFIKEGQNDLLNKINALGSSEQTSGSLPPKQRDQRLVSIFLTEGSDILHEVVKLNELLQSQPNNYQIKKAIYSELHAFYRGSQMLSIDELETLSSRVNLLSKFAMDTTDLPEGFNLLLIEVVEVLTGMLNRIASQETIDSAEGMIEKVDNWMAEAQVSNAPEDMDTELVELFVEEGEELIEMADGLLERWKENLNSKSINTELRRVYHTLKGSSRMAGAMSIGELAYATEDIFNTVMDFGRELSSIDYDVTLLATKKLEEMIAVLKGFSWPEEAEREIALVRQLLSSEGLEQTGLEQFLAETHELEQSSIEPEPTSSVADFTAETLDAVEDHKPELEQSELEQSELEQSEYTDLVTELELPQSSESLLQDHSLDSLEDIPLENIPESNIDLVAEEKSTADAVSNQFEDSKDTHEVDKEVMQSIEAVKERESSTEVKVADTIEPAAPVTFTGEVQKIELDEDGEEVLEIYLEEAEELLMSMDEALHDWAKNLENKESIDLLQRTLHTFKGGARLSDLIVLGDLTHEMETYFERVNSGQLTAKQQDVEFLLNGYDIIESLVNEVKDHRQMTVPENYMQQLDALIKGKAIEQIDVKPLEEETVKSSSKKDESKKTAPQKAKQEKSQKKKAQTKPASEDTDKPSTDADTSQRPSKTSDIVRVSSDQLEGLVNLAGETSIFRSRLEQQVVMLRYNLEEMSSTVERLREQLRNLDIETDAQISYRKEVSGGNEYEDFDPLEMDRYTRQQELTRGLNESSVDLLSLKESLDTLASDSETLLLQQGRVNTEMQESLMRTRMTPFESLVPRLRRMVRQISSELGKTIELSISADGEMDRTVLERLIAPLEHMLRNAMDHGIEQPEERQAQNKNEAGKVSISLYREGGEVFVKIQDDGRGLNLKAIRKKAIEKGLITESSDLTDHELQQLILEAGFSTAEKVTQISGRGVGMDVVSSEIKQMGGVIEIDSEEGVGTVFTVKLPFSVSVNQALMVQVGEEIFAIPLSSIEGIVRVSPYELEEYYSNEDSAFKYAGIDYSMYYLGQMLDHSRGVNLQGVSESLPVLLLHGAEHPTAMQVDELLGSREIVVKSIGSQLSSISGLSGATILGDGRVVLILDMPALIRRIDANLEQDKLLIDEQVVEEEERAIRVMVVDDSITVRKVTTRLLERHGFEVITAKDGVDALSVLNDHDPDVMLLDIEMPRMDGFELATIIRHDEKLKELPIIMITSRTGEKHRERANQIGVNQYMGKPYNEVDLIDSISALLPERV